MRNESKGGADAVRGGRREAASLNCVSSARASAFTFSKAALQHVAALWRCGKLSWASGMLIYCLQGFVFVYLLVTMNKIHMFFMKLLAICARWKHVLLICYRKFSYFCPFKFSYFYPFKYFFGHVYTFSQQVCVFLQQVCVFLPYCPVYLYKIALRSPKENDAVYPCNLYQIALSPVYFYEIALSPVYFYKIALSPVYFYKIT